MSEEIKRAIERFEQRNKRLHEVQDNGDAGCVDMETWDKYQMFIEDNDLAIKSLQSYQWTPDSENRPVGVYVPVLRESKDKTYLYEDSAYYLYRLKEKESWMSNDFTEPHPIKISDVTHYFILPPVPEKEELK